MIIRFGEFTLDARNRVLLREQLPVPVQPKVFDLIALLASRPGELITTDDLREALWKNVHVGPDALRSSIRAARKALGDGGNEPLWIRTRKGLGYVFIGRAERDAARAPRPVPREPQAWPFVGREAELGTLIGAVALASREASGGEGAFCFLAGEAGAGKSTLLAELRARLRPGGGSWWIGHCQAGEGVRPFWPWCEVATQIVEDPALRERVEALTPQDRDVLHRFASPGGASLTPFEPTTGAEQRFVLSESFGAVLRRLAKAGPLFVTVEDLHWADDASLLILETLGRATRQHPICVFATYRPHEVRERSPLGELVGRTRGRKGVTSVDVNAFTLAELRRLLVELRGMTTAFTAETLETLTGGNPLFVQQLLRHASATRLHFDAELPPSFRHIVAERVRLLPEATRRLLSRASVLGHEFVASVLADMEDRELHETLAHLQPAVSAGVLQAGPAATMRFCHALLRDALYERLPAEERELYHREALNAWASTPAGAARAGALASHAFLAGSAVAAARTQELCERAGRDALEDLAFDRAAVHLERALALLPAPPSYEAASLALLHARARLQADESPERVAAAFTRAAELARSMAAPDLFAEAAIGATVGDDSPMELAFAQGRQTERALLEETLTLLDANDGPRRNQVARVLAWLRSAGGDVEGARQAARLALAHPPPPADTFAHALHLGLACMDAIWDGEIPRARSLRSDVAPYCRHAELTPRRRIELGLQTMVLSLLLGDLPGFAQVRGEIEALVEDLPQPPPFGRLGERLLLFRLLPSVARTTIATMEGDFAGAQSALAATLEQVARLEMPPAQDGDVGVFLLMPLLAYQGRSQILEPMLDGMKLAAGEVFPTAARAQFALERDALDEARSHWQVLRGAGFRRTVGGRRMLPAPQALVAMADVCAVIGDAADAEALHGMLLPMASSCAVEGIALSVGSYSRPLGELAAKLGRLDLAERHFTEAMAMNRHHRPERARTQLGLARTLSARGRASEARSLVASARSEAQAMGLTQLGDGLPHLPA